MLWKAVRIWNASGNFKERVRMLGLARIDKKPCLHFLFFHGFLRVWARVLRLQIRVFRARKCCVYIEEGLWTTCRKRKQVFDPKRFDLFGIYSIYFDFK